jgi:hypothetical protein
VADYELAPKSVVRDMYERAMTFGEYVAFYGLSRSEGLVLRYLADAYQALRRTVPEDSRTEELTDLIEWLGELVRQVDSSLLDEWERLRDPLTVDEEVADIERPPPAVTRNRRAFRVLVRNALFRRVELAALRDWESLGELDGADGFTAAEWAAALAPYYEEYADIGVGPDARGPSLLLIDEKPDRWDVRQIFDDPEEDHDWAIEATVDLAASDSAGVASVTVTRVGTAASFD